MAVDLKTVLRSGDYLRRSGDILVGDPGPSGAVIVKGTLSGTSTPLPPSPKSGDMWLVGSPVPTAVPPRPGGGAAQPGDAIVWDGAHWQNIGPIQGPPGTINGMFNVADYGAVGNGVTDDTAAVAAAVAAAAVKGGCVTFGGGTFVVGNIICPTKVSLRGSGQGSTQLLCKAGTTGNWFQVGSYSEVSGLWLNGNGQNVTGLYLYQAARSMIHHLYVQNSGANTGHAIVARGTSTGAASHGIHYSDINIIGWGGIGVHLAEFAYDSELVHVWVGTCGTGVLCYTGAQQLTGVHIWGCTANGLHLEDGTLSRISNCYFESNTGWGIYSKSGGRGWWVSNSEVWANTGGGIFLEGGSRTRVINCTIFDNTGPGIHLKDHLNALIEGNHFYNYSGTLQTTAVLETGTTDRTIILGNFADAASHSSGVAFTTIGTGTQVLANYTASSIRTLSLMPSMTGQSSTVAVDAPAGQNKGLAFRTGSSLRWLFRTDNGAESGSNAGTGLQIVAYSDAGAFLNTPMTILRSTGLVSFPNGISITDAKDIVVGSTTGTRIATSASSKIAFYGATPIARPSVPAAATDAATTQTLVNALRTALVNLGLVQ